MTEAWLRSRRHLPLLIGVVLAVFVALSLVEPNAPGLYMDAVNPDYEVVKILHPDAPIEVQEIPGDLLFGRFPVMQSLYGGSYAAYWALPFYLAMGGSILSIRIAHLCIGAIVLALMATLCRRVTGSATIALVTVFVLALDPTFLFLFRTQAYMEMIGTVFFLAGLALLYGGVSPRRTFASGVLLGLSAFGYFVFLFALPGIAFFVLRDRTQTRRKSTLLMLGAGIAAGLSPYAFAYGLFFQALGFAGGFAWLHDALAGLHVASADASYVERVGSIVSTTSQLLDGQWQWRTFWNESHGDVGQSVKSLVLLIVIASAFLAKRPSAGAGRALAAALFPAMSFLIFATYFGSRLGGHDLSPIVPLAYLCAAVSAATCIELFARAKAQIAIGLGVCALFIAIANLTATASIFQRLATEAGAGPYSSVISTIPKEALAGRTAIPYIFWTWGELMPFIYETGGSIPAFSGGQLATALCRYGDARIVFLGDDALLAKPAGANPFDGLTVANTSFARDPQSRFPYKMATVKFARPHAACATGSPISETPSNTEPASGTVTTSGPMIHLVASQSVPGVVFDSTPGVVAAKVGDALPTVTIEWRVPSASEVEVHMSKPDGILFARGTNAGEATTGAWVQAGNRFYLQDVSAGRPGKTAAILTASPCAHCVPSR